MKKTFLLTSFVALLAAQSAFAANYIMQNVTLGYDWSGVKAFETDATIWKNAVLPTSGNHTLSMSSQYDSTVSITTTSYSFTDVKIGRYDQAPFPTTLTLNVSQDLTATGLFKIGADGGSAVVDIIGAGTVVSAGGNVTIGDGTTVATGELKLTSGSTFVTTSAFVMNSNSTVNVVDGTLKMLQTDIIGNVSLVMSAGAILDLQGDSELWLTGDQTVVGSDFNTYLASGWITSNGNTGAANFSQVYDGTNTIVSVALVPEPATYALLGGLLALGSVMMRRRK
jgi:hypothetical protein